MMLIPSSAWIRFSSLRIWSWTMTSRAVVGSSAMITWGPQESAMAITARCLIPPENSCG